MKLNTNQSKIVEFVSSKPNSDAKAIEKATKLKGAELSSDIKKLLEAKILVRHEKNKKVKYTAQAISLQEPATVEAATAEAPEETMPATPTVDNKEGAAVVKDAEKTKSASGRDTTKFKFGGSEYGKGPLALAVVKKFVEDNPKIIFPNLKKTFPDELLKRFGIVQEVKEANKLGNGRNRFFLKPEQLIKLKDGKTVAVCNQFTGETLKPFLAVAKKLGYSIR